MEKSHSINGVSGRYWAIKNPGVRADGCFDTQKWLSESRTVKEYGNGARLTVEIRFDDQCKNGKNSFAITGDIRGPKGQDIASGCLHEDIATVFPELSHLIQWNLCDMTGPMYYVANTTYHAGDRDHRGHTKGEASSFDTMVTFSGVPIAHVIPSKFWKWLQDHKASGPGQSDFDFEIIRVDHRDNGKPGVYQFAPKFTFGGFDCEWHTCPFDNEERAAEWLISLQKHSPIFGRIATAWSEGKARDLNAARNCAVWPDATDEELCAPRPELERALLARLPALLARMRADIEAAGFVWSAPEKIEG